MTLTRLHPDDAAAYRALRLEALRTDPDSFGTAYEAEAALPLEAHAARLGSSAVFAASLDGAPSALAGLRQDGGKFAHKALLWGMWVAPAARRRGLADAILHAIIDHARPPIVQVHLTVLARNAPAIALYARHGFIQYGREPRAIRTSLGLEDELLMARLS